MSASKNQAEVVADDAEQREVVAAENQNPVLDGVAVDGGGNTERQIH